MRGARLVSNGRDQVRRALKAALLLALACGLHAQDSITGKVIYSGPKPVVRNISMEANPVCFKLHPNGVPATDLILNPDNTVRNALVYVKAGIFGQQFPAPAQAIRVDQKGCMFEPRMVALMVNQRLEVANGDATNHNVHVMPEANPDLNVTQPPQAPAKVIQFAKPEIGIVVMCNIHPWMRLYVHALANPYYSITGEDGTFAIKGLPPGTYTIEVWHEKLGVQEKKIKTGNKSDFTFAE